MLPGQVTLVACWRALAATSPDAEVVESANAVVATFPSFAPFNNAIMTQANDNDIDAEAARIASAYSQARVKSWALWIPSPTTTFDARDAVCAISAMKRDMTTLVMETTIGTTHRTDRAARPASVAVACRAGDEPIPTDHLRESAPDADLAGWVMVDGDVAIAGAYRFLHGSDCGIYAVGTTPAWRRRGIARRLVKHVLADAARMGARTATLQSTIAAQSVYESLGFAPAGRYEEWVADDS